MDSETGRSRSPAGPAEAGANSAPAIAGRQKLRSARIEGSRPDRQREVECVCAPRRPAEPSPSAQSCTTRQSPAPTCERTFERHARRDRRGRARERRERGGHGHHSSNPEPHDEPRPIDVFPGRRRGAAAPDTSSPIAGRFGGVVAGSAGRTVGRTLTTRSALRVRRSDRASTPRQRRSPAPRIAQGSKSPTGRSRRGGSRNGRRPPRGLHLGMGGGARASRIRCAPPRARRRRRGHHGARPTSPASAAAPPRPRRGASVGSGKRLLSVALLLVLDAHARTSTCVHLHHRN